MIHTQIDKTFGINFDDFQREVVTYGDGDIWTPNHFQLWKFRARAELSRQIGREASISMYEGRRNGKTEYCLNEAKDIELGGRNVIYISLDRESASDNWDHAVEILAPYATRINRVNRPTVEVIDEIKELKGVIRMFSGNKAVTGRGAKARAVFIDEAHMIPEAAYQRLAPALLTERGFTMLAWTPPETPAQQVQAAWLKRMTESADENGRMVDRRNWVIQITPTSPVAMAHVFWRMEIDEGKPERPWFEYLDMGTKGIEDLRVDMGNEAFNRECKLDDKIPGDRIVFGELPISDIITRNAEFDPAYPVFCCLDEGKGGDKTKKVMAYTVALYFQVKPTGQLDSKGKPLHRYVFFDELVASRVIGNYYLAINELLRFSRDTATPLDMFKKDSDSHAGRASAYRPPYGFFPDVRATNFEEAAKGVFKLLYSENVNVESGISHARRYMREGRLHVNPRCRLLKQNLVMWARDAVTHEPLDIDNDAAQAMIYGVHDYDVIMKVDRDVKSDNRVLAREGGSDGIAILAL